MLDHADASNPYAPAEAAEPPLPRERAARPWSWAVHCLIGLVLGAVGAALQHAPWNQPIYRATIVPNLVVLPIYFAGLAVHGRGLREIGLAIVVVLLSEGVAFNGIIYALHGAIDLDTIATPLALLVVYLSLFVSVGGLLGLVRRLVGGGGADRG